MKTSKLVAALFVVGLLTSSLYAENDSNVGEKAGKMVDKLNLDVALTDSQKIVIQAKAKDFLVKKEKANKQISKEEKESKHVEANSLYIAVIDSILSVDQGAQLLMKQEERKNAIINKYQTKK